MRARQRKIWLANDSFSAVTMPYVWKSKDPQNYAEQERWLMLLLRQTSALSYTSSTSLKFNCERIFSSTLAAVLYALVAIGGLLGFYQMSFKRVTWSYHWVYQGSSDARCIRLALQTREQHIKREKEPSISQHAALSCHISGFYAVSWCWRP